MVLPGVACAGSPGSRFGGKFWLADDPGAMMGCTNLMLSAAMAHVSVGFQSKVISTCHCFCGKAGARYFALADRRLLW